MVDLLKAVQEGLLRVGGESRRGGAAEE